MTCEVTGMFDADAVFKDAAGVAHLGWKVVRLYGLDDDGSCTCGRGACETPGKHPIGVDWPSRATSDEHTIAAWLDSGSPFNIGVLLGPASGLIDVECDSREAEQAASRYGLDQIDTPSYRSSRGVHRLFRWESDLPDKAVLKVDGIEVRLGGGSAAQSVMPPSIHSSGTRYEWLPGKSPEDIAPARLPDAFRKAVLEGEQARGCVRQAIARTAKGEKVRAGGRHAYLLGEASHLAYCEPNLESESARDRILQLVLSLNKTQCDPPKEAAEVERICLDQINFYRRARQAGRPDLKSTDPDAERLVRTHSDPWISFGLEKKDDLWFPGQWRLVVVHSDPKHYRLLIPNTDGCEPFEVILTPEEFTKPQKVASRILAVTGVINVCDPTPTAWSKVWCGYRKRNGGDVRGLQVQLTDAGFRSDEDPPPEEKRYAIVAGLFLDELSRANAEIDERHIAPTSNGSPQWLYRNGRKELWFNYTELLKRIREFAGQEVTTANWRTLSKLIKSHTGEKEFLASQSSDGPATRKRYLRWDDRHLESLRRLAGVSGH